MPFTPSHAVVALPFARTVLPASAVAVGAMTPDLPLFTRQLPTPYVVTHDPRAILVTTAMAAVLWLVWRVVLRPAVRPLAPTWLARRLPEAWDASPRRQFETLAARTVRARVTVIAWWVLALAMGVATHLVWDAFSHEGRWGSAIIPVLAQMWGPLDGYRWVQYTSSAFGLLVLAVWATMTLARSPRMPAPRANRYLRLAWWASLPAILVLAWVCGLVIGGGFTHEYTPQHLAYRVLPPAAALWGAVTVALCVRVQWRTTRSAADTWLA
jgi:Domain of unknown function (DUF4184)